MIEVPRDLLWDVVVPVVQWGAAVLVCVFLAVWLGGILRRLDEEEEPGRRGCPNCGYDVRATPEVCPECGHMLPQEQPEQAAASTGNDMPVYTIPPDSGPFTVVQGPDASFAVADVRATGSPATAAKLGFVFIPCRDEAQAQELAERLNRGEHDGSVQVNLLDIPAPGEARKGDA